MESPFLCRKILLDLRGRLTAHKSQNCECLCIYRCSGRRRGCSGSISERRPPSFGQSSELHQANGNSTGIVCGKQVKSERRSSPIKVELHSLNCSPAHPPQSYVTTRVGLSIVKRVCFPQSARTRFKRVCPWLKKKTKKKIKNVQTVNLRAWTRLRSVNSWRSTKA